MNTVALATWLHSLDGGELVSGEFEMSLVPVHHMNGHIIRMDRAEHVNVRLDLSLNSDDPGLRVLQQICMDQAQRFPVPSSARAPMPPPTTAPVAPPPPPSAPPAAPAVRPPTRFGLLEIDEDE